MKIKNKFIKRFMPLFLVGAFVIGSAFALLTDTTPKLANCFTFAYSDIVLTEPLWDAERTVPIAAGEAVPKDPQVTNLGDSEAYVYLAIFNPVVDTYVHSSRNDYYDTKANKQVYKYKINPNWEFAQTMMQSGEWRGFRSETFEYNNQTYAGEWELYFYKEPVAPGETTEPLFNEIKMINYNPEYEYFLEEQEALGIGEGSEVLDKSFPLPVNAYAITTDVREAIFEEYSDNIVTDEDLEESGYCADPDNTKYFVNCGPGFAWNYLYNELSSSGITDNGSSVYETVYKCPVGFFKVGVTDLENNPIQPIDKETGEEVDIAIYGCTGDYLDLESFNKLVLYAGGRPFETIEEVFNVYNFPNDSFSKDYGGFNYWCENTETDTVLINNMYSYCYLNLNYTDDTTGSIETEVKVAIPVMQYDVTTDLAHNSPSQAYVTEAYFEQCIREGLGINVDILQEDIKDSAGNTITLDTPVNLLESYYISAEIASPEDATELTLNITTGEEYITLPADGQTHLLPIEITALPEETDYALYIVNPYVFGIRVALVEENGQYYLYGSAESSRSFNSKFELRYGSLSAIFEISAE